MLCRITAILSLVFSLLFLAHACVPNAGEVKVAHEALYRMSPELVLETAMEVAKDKRYEIQLDRQHRVFAAHPSGSMIARDTQAPRQYPGGYPHWALEVAVIGTADGCRVTVTPKVWQERLYAQPVYFSPDDPNTPGFVLDRADALSLAIYHRLSEQAGAPQQPSPP